MKNLVRILAFTSITLAGMTVRSQTTFTLNPLGTFGSGASVTNTAGYIQPGESLGISPINGNNVVVSSIGYGVQPGDSTSTPTSTNGFNMRGLSYDPVSGNLVLVDTHTGQNGSQVMVTNSAVYVLSSATGGIIGALKTNGLVNNGGGRGCVCAVGVADDGVVYGTAQINPGASTAFKIYRWPTADTNNQAFTNFATVAFSNTFSPIDRIGQTLDVRGAGTNTQIIIGTAASGGGTGTNVYLFTTGDGTNFTGHHLLIPGLTNVVLNDGIAFGLGNTFWTKQV